MKLLDGKAIAQRLQQRLQAVLRGQSLTPGLASIVVGDNPASMLYLKLKERGAREVGIHFERQDFAANVAQEQIHDAIQKLNQKQIIHGILVQLPLPAGLNTNQIIESIDPQKDVDGFHPHNLAKLESGSISYPVILKAILALLDAADVNPQEKIVMVLGKTDVFLRPFRSVFTRLGAQVVERSSLDAKAIQSADILMSALGQPHVLNAEHIKPGATVIDIGTTPTPKGVLGDVDMESVKDLPGWITPVPGGVGPMTVAMVLVNTALAAGIPFDWRLKAS